MDIEKLVNYCRHDFFNELVKEGNDMLNERAFMDRLHQYIVSVLLDKHLSETESMQFINQINKNDSFRSIC